MVMDSFFYDGVCYDCWSYEEPVGSAEDETMREILSTVDVGWLFGTDC